MANSMAEADFNLARIKSRRATNEAVRANLEARQANIDARQAKIEALQANIEEKAEIDRMEYEYMARKNLGTEKAATTQQELPVPSLNVPINKSSLDRDSMRDSPAFTILAASNGLPIKNEIDLTSPEPEKQSEVSIDTPVIVKTERMDQISLREPDQSRSRRRISRRLPIKIEIDLTSPEPKDQSAASVSPTIIVNDEEQEQKPFYELHDHQEPSEQDQIPEQRVQHLTTGARPADQTLPVRRLKRRRRVIVDDDEDSDEHVEDEDNNDGYDGLSSEESGRPHGGKGSTHRYGVNKSFPTVCKTRDGEFFEYRCQWQGCLATGRRRSGHKRFLFFNGIAGLARHYKNKSDHPNYNEADVARSCIHHVLSEQEVDAVLREDTEGYNVDRVLARDIEIGTRMGAPKPKRRYVRRTAHLAQPDARSMRDDVSGDATIVPAEGINEEVYGVQVARGKNVAK